MHHRQPIAPGICTLRLLVLAVAVLAALTSPSLSAQSSPEQRELVKTRRIFQQWQKDLKITDTALIEGEYRKAIKKATQILRNTEDTLVSGDIAHQLLGTAFVLRAFGFYQTGDLERSAWSWFSGLAVWPEAKDLTMNAYGEAGPWLKGLEARTEADFEAMRLGIQAGIGQADVQAPKKLHAPAPVYPRGQRYDPNSGGRLAIAMIVGADGKPRKPALMSRGGPATFISATLEKLEQWRFQPAMRDGQSVAVGFTLSVNFELKR